MGELYSRDGQDLVLKWSKFHNVEPIIEKLRSRMTNTPKSPLPTDKSPAQGELGLFNAYQIMSDPNLMAKMKAEGLFREKAVVQFFFISDEQDVCFDYKQFGNGAKPAFNAKEDKVPATPSSPNDVAGRDPFEQWTYDNICNTAGESGHLQYTDVEKIAKTFTKDNKLKKVIFSGATYWNDQSIPRRKSDRWADEKEVGFGYNQLISTSHMDQIDLSASDYTAQLAKLGLHTSVEMLTDGAKIDCSIQGGGDVKSIISHAEPGSFEVKLTDQNDQPIAGVGAIKSCDDPDKCAVAVTDGSGENLRVVLPREQVKKALQGTPLPKATITFNERQSDDGDHVKGVTGLFKRIRNFRKNVKNHQAETATDIAPAAKSEKPAAPAKRGGKSEKPKSEVHSGKHAAAAKPVDSVQSLKNIFDAAPENTKPKAHARQHTANATPAVKPAAAAPVAQAAAKPVAAAPAQTAAAKPATGAPATAAAKPATAPTANQPAAADDDDDD
jgi:hypothetical protein